MEIYGNNNVELSQLIHPSNDFRPELHIPINEVIV